MTIGHRNVPYIYGDYMRTIIPDFREVLETRKRKECTGKKGWSNRQDAARNRKKIEKAHSGQVFTEYYCEFCGLFHVGHKRLQIKERRK